MGLIEQGKNSREDKPYYINLYGDPGLGKSTFGSEAPNPYFIDLDGGLNQLDVMAFKPTSFSQILSLVDELTNDKHSYETLVIDTIDKVEKMIAKEIAVSKGKEVLMEVKYIGGDLAYNEMKKLTDRLSILRDKMNVVLLGHSIVKSPPNPMGDDHLRAQPNMGEKCLSLITQAVEAQLYATTEVFTKKDGLKIKATGDGTRVVYTSNHPAHMAKNRYKLPETISLSWDGFSKLASKKIAPQSEVESLKDNVTSILTEIIDQKVKSAAKKSADETTDPLKLKKIIDRLTIIQSKQGEANA